MKQKIQIILYRNNVSSFSNNLKINKVHQFEETKKTKQSSKRNSVLRKQMVYTKMNELPLNVRKHIFSYNDDIIDYIHIRYTVIKLRTRIFNYDPCYYKILKLMHSIRHLFTRDGDFSTTNYSSRGVSQLLGAFRHIVPWNTYVPTEHPWSLDVFIAIVSCGYSCIDRTNLNPIKWKFKITLRRRFNYSIQCHRYLTI